VGFEGGFNMQTLSIAKGELWHRDGDGQARAITSRFANEVIERDARSRRNTSWKHAPREQQTGVIPSGSLWGAGQSAAPMTPPRFQFACAGADARTLYYVLGVGGSTGLFRLHLDEDREVRLFHRHALQVRGLAFNPADRRLVLGITREDGTAHLEVYDEEGTLKGAITAGDTVDVSPSLVPGTASGVVYQSSGVARNPQTGQVVAFGHAAIQRLDYRTGEQETLLDDAQYDFIAPRIGSDGTLYAIRRPIEKPAHERAGGALVDTVMMPFRLAKAIFGYLNFFSMIYGKEPLRSSGGPRTPALDQDVGQLWLHGRMIELSRVTSDPQYAGNLVPRSWELVRKPPGRALQIVAPHVASFDLVGPGSVVFSNGYDVVHWRDGERRTLGRHELVESLAVVGATGPA
jgi:hypothetical protein